MKFFIILNLLILTIILLRYLVDGRITRRQQYAMWIAIPVFVSLFFFVRIPLQVRTEVKKEMINVPSETIIKTEENTEIDSTSVIVEDSYNAQVNETPVVNQENHNNEYNQNISNFSEISDYHKSQEPVKTDKVIDYSSILKLIWILGASLIGLAITIKNSIFGIRIIKNREYYTRSNPGNLKVYKLNKISSPFLFGNSIYIDKKMQENSKEYLHAICHEYSHFNLVTVYG